MMPGKAKLLHLLQLQHLRTDRAQNRHSITSEDLPDGGMQDIPPVCNRLVGTYMHKQERPVLYCPVYPPGRSTVVA